MSLIITFNNRRYRDLPIQRKISLVIIMGIVSALVVAVINFVSLDRMGHKTAMVEELRVLARITAARSTAAIAFGDQNNAHENLATLGLRSSIQQACIYRLDNTLFASYVAASKIFGDCPAVLPDRTARYEFGQGLLLVEPVLRKNKIMGTITLVSDLTSLRARVNQWLITGVIVVVMALLIAFMLTRRMQAAIVSPIVNLAAIMDDVKRTNDLTLRAERQSRDEVGGLVESFNDLLDILYYDNLDLAILHRNLVNKSAEAEATAASLEVSNKHIKELFSGAAHDLRQPLQAMAIFIDALKQRLKDEDQREIVEKLKQSMSNLRELFHEILDVSRYEFDLTVVGTKPTPIKQLTEKLRLEFDALAGEKGLQLRFHVPNYTVVAHAALLERIIRNLLSNAIRYTDKGGVLLGCRKQGAYLRVEVWDTGCGIPERKLEQIFSRFTQLGDEGEKRGGYGLGLAIVKQFVDTLGYQLDVKSTEGRGSVFILTIPLLAHETRLPALESSPAQVASPSPTPTARPVEARSKVVVDQLETLVKERIFLIDDDESVRTAVRLMLEGWDMQVTEFDGLTSLATYLEENEYLMPDVIISDYQLGNDVTGDKVIAYARQALGGSIPAFIMSGAEASIWQDIVGTEIPSIKKPVKPARLRAMLNHVLS